MLGTIAVSDSGRQRELTYNGHPLYRFASDVKPGEITGQGNPTFGAPWWLVSPVGNAITKKG
jgi:predicted lipoprotein with Yx(FWY)xxD motif